MLPGEAHAGDRSSNGPCRSKRMKAAFGLDLPIWQQYFIYLQIVTLEWGRSFLRRKSPL